MIDFFIIKVKQFKILQILLFGLHSLSIIENKNTAHIVIYYHINLIFNIKKPLKGLKTRV